MFRIVLIVSLIRNVMFMRWFVAAAALIVENKQLFILLYVLIATWT